MLSFIIAGSLNVLLSFLIFVVDRDFILPLIIISLVATIYGGIIGFRLWYTAWSVIQDGHARTTPGKAIGFCFIPLFNFYWIFQMVHGYSKDYNAYLKRHAIEREPLSEQFFLTATIVVLVTGLMKRIPVLGAFAALFSFLVLLYVMNALLDAVNNLCALDAQTTGISPEKKPIKIEWIAPLLAPEHRTMLIVFILIANALLSKIAFFCFRFFPDSMYAFINIHVLMTTSIFLGSLVWLMFRCTHKTLRYIGLGGVGLLVFLEICGYGFYFWG